MPTIGEQLAAQQQVVDRAKATEDRFFQSQPSGGFSSGGAAAFQNEDYALQGNTVRAAQENERLKQQAQFDPWGFYRPAAADSLAKFGAQGDPSAGIRSQLQAMAGGEDPSNYYRDKLKNMSNGTFGAEDPSYRWRFDQGQQAVVRSLGARGLLDSGKADIELQQYGQGAASQEYGAQFDRTLKSMSGVSQQYTDQFNRLTSGMAGIDSSYNNQFNRLAAMAGININPQGIGTINNQAMGNAVQAQGNALDYSAKMASIGNDRQQQQDDMGLQYQYQQGIADARTRAQTAPSENIYESYSGGGGYSQGDPTPSNAFGQETGTGFVVRTS